MKIIGYLYEKIYDKENIREAVLLASRNKKKRKDVKKFLKNINIYVNKIHKLLIENRYVFTQGKTKTINENIKPRNITIPLFRDLVIQYSILNIIKPILFKSMYKWSCGSIPNRGNIYAMKYTKKVIQKHKPKYCLKLDIKKFYHNVDIKILYEQIERKIKDKKTLSLIWELLNIGSIDEKGIPIGFYTSQWFSNFHLTDLDNCIKQDLKVKYYVRYVDDLVLFGNNKRKLRTIRDYIINFLKEKLNLSVKENYQLFPIEHRMVDFVGFRIGYSKVLIRKNIFKMFKKRLLKVYEKINIYYARSYLSYYGWFHHLKKFIEFYSDMKNKAIKYIKDYYSKPILC